MKYEAKLSIAAILTALMVSAPAVAGSHIDGTGDEKSGGASEAAASNSDRADDRPSDPPSDPSDGAPAGTPGEGASDDGRGVADTASNWDGEGRGLGAALCGLFSSECGGSAGSN